MMHSTKKSETVQSVGDGLCPVCDEPLDDDAEQCAECEMLVHVDCGESIEDDLLDWQFFCLDCLEEEDDE